MREEFNNNRNSKTLNPMLYYRVRYDVSDLISELEVEKAIPASKDNKEKFKYLLDNGIACIFTGFMSGKKYIRLTLRSTANAITSDISNM